MASPRPVGSVAGEREARTGGERTSDVANVHPNVTTGGSGRRVTSSQSPHTASMHGRNSRTAPGTTGGKRHGAGSGSNGRKWMMDTGEEESRIEFEKYRAEARTRATAGKFYQAIDMYSKALQLKERHPDCLMARATCHLEVCNFSAALKDADTAIKVNDKLALANFIKAEALYQKGDFEHSLMCYHRARRLRPGAAEYDRGIQKAECAIEACIGDGVNTRLTKEGDMSYFENQKSVSKPGDQSVDLLAHQSSAKRREVLSKQEVQQPAVRRRHKDSRTVRHLLEDLYGDWRYLDMLLNDEDRMLSDIVVEAQNEEAKRRRLIKEKRDALKGNNPLKQVEEDDDKLVPPDSFGEDMRKRKRQFSESIRGLAENEMVYLEERADFWLQQRPAARRHQANKQDTTRSDAVRSADVLGVLDEIEEALGGGRAEEALRRATTLLQQVKQGRAGRDPGRTDELLGHLHSHIGNAHSELGRLDLAVQHHHEELSLARQRHNQSAKSRALDNLGRSYAKKGSYKEAIEVFEEKLPMVCSALESTWLYHELGRCYLEKGNHVEAQACAEKSTVSASQTDERGWQINASVLLAHTEIEMQNYPAAQAAYGRALEYAELDADDAAAAALRRALKDIDERVTHSSVGDITASSEYVVSEGQDNETDLPGDIAPAEGGEQTTVGGAEGGADPDGGAGSLPVTPATQEEDPRLPKY